MFNNLKTLPLEGDFGSAFQKLIITLILQVWYA